MSWAALLGFLESFPKLLDLFDRGIAAYEKRTAEMQESRIALGQKDMNNAKTSDEIKKAADEQADALRHL